MDSNAFEAVAIINGTKVYGTVGLESSVTAISNISLSVAKGKFIAIMGPSGSGKSTLLHCMAGLDNLTEGKVSIGSVDLSRLGDNDLTKLRRSYVGFMFQSFNLLPTLDAKQNILLPLTLSNSKIDTDWFNHLVDLLQIKDRLNHKPFEMSGGQQQRVAAARALISKPTVIFADEPTGNLDSKSGNSLLEILRNSVHELGQTIVMVTHDANAASYADEVVLLKDGQIVNIVYSPTQKSVIDALELLGS